jgi:hypothetical protein
MGTSTTLAGRTNPSPLAALASSVLWDQQLVRELFEWSGDGGVPLVATEPPTLVWPTVHEPSHLSRLLARLTPSWLTRTAVALWPVWLRVIRESAVPTPSL